MLGRYYRIGVLNQTGQPLAASAVTVKALRWNWANPATGEKTWETAAVTLFQDAASIANGAFFVDTTDSVTQPQPNGAFIGGTFACAATAPTSASGNVSFYLQNSPDGTTWDDGVTNFGTLIATMYFSAAGTQTINVEV